MPVKVQNTLTAVAIFCVFFLQGCNANNAQETYEYVQPTLSLQLKTETVIAEDIDYSTNTAGALMAARQTPIRFEQASGALVAMRVTEGAILNKGDSIAELDTTAYNKELAVQELQNERWQLTNSRNALSLREAENNLRLTEIALQNLGAAQGTAAYESAAIQLELAQSNLEMTRINNRLSTLEYESFLESYALFQAAKEEYTLKSQYDGIVTFVEKIQEGEQVSAGRTVARMIENRYAVIKIQSGDAVYLANQDDLTVIVDDVAYDAAVYEPVQSDDIWVSDPEAVVPTVVYIAFKDAVPKLTPNKTSALTVAVQKKDALTVSKGCVKTVNGLTSVDLKVGETYYSTPVVCGVENGDRIEILSGLSAGDVVSAE